MPHHASPAFNFRAPDSRQTTILRTGFAPFRSKLTAMLLGPLALWGCGLGWVHGAEPQLLITPEGTLELRQIELVAPDAAIEAYIINFSHREWIIRMDSRGAFLGILMGLELDSVLRNELFDPKNWTPLPEGDGFIVKPAAQVLRRLKPGERAELYRELAFWTDNKPERWPLVISDEKTFARLPAAGVSPQMIQRARELSYPFAGGWALSDFSVLAEEFPDQSMLQTFLREISTVQSKMPRINLRTAISVSQTLEYWTVDRQNPFALPLLEALLESETTNGIEILSIMPGAARVLAFNLDAKEVSYDISLNSFLISASLSGPPPRVQHPDQIYRWLEDRFRLAPYPTRYGDLWGFTHPDDHPVKFACAQIADNLVFTRDPVGLGLWQFMPLSDLLRRNPNFAGGNFELRRAVKTAPHPVPRPPSS
jgi:hypothetical protein